MRIHVIGPSADAGAQIRAYAEYRVFARLAPLVRDIRSVQVVLNRSGTDGTTSCELMADLGAAGSIRTRARRLQPTRAVDDATERLLAATIRRLEVAAY
jgi:ribosome-associated translation inhibitor RaiA